MHKIKLGLEAMRSFLVKIDQPERKLKFIHVAGTNGKGSVSASLSAILQQAGYRVGLYTSPHLSSIRERFRINDTFISEDTFAACAARIIDALGDDHITYFEFTTALGLLWFSESDLDIVILETGLGGRLDATNVVTPLVSVITSISMDHEQYLGNTVEAVAGEKAGIIKSGVPVIAAGNDDQVVQVLKETSRLKDAPLYVLGKDFIYTGGNNNDWSWQPESDELGQQLEHLSCRMRGSYQRENASLVIATIMLLAEKDFSVTGDQIRQGLSRVSWPGRLEYLKLRRNGEKRAKGYLLDGAHNPEGVNHLAATLKEEFEYRNLILIWGAMADKDVAAGLKTILSLADRLILTQPDSGRSASPEQLVSCLPTDNSVEVDLQGKVASAVELAESMATDEDLIVVAGSLYLVGAVRTLLVGELAD